MDFFTFLLFSSPPPAQQQRNPSSRIRPSRPSTQHGRRPLYLEPASHHQMMMTQQRHQFKMPGALCPFGGQKSPLCSGRRDRSREKQWPAHHSSLTWAPTAQQVLLLRPRTRGTDQSGLQAISFPTRREFAAAVDWTVLLLPDPLLGQTVPSFSSSSSCSNPDRGRNEWMVDYTTVLPTLEQPWIGAESRRKYGKCVWEI